MIERLRVRIPAGVAEELSSHPDSYAKQTTKMTFPPPHPPKKKKKKKPGGETAALNNNTTSHRTDRWQTRESVNKHNTNSRHTFTIISCTLSVNRTKGTPVYISILYINPHRDSSLVRASDAWSKGCEFESQQERRENLLLQSQLCVLTLIRCPFHPPCYRCST